MLRGFKTNSHGPQKIYIFKSESEGTYINKLILIHKDKPTVGTVVKTFKDYKLCAFEIPLSAELTNLFIEILK